MKLMSRNRLVNVLRSPWAIGGNLVTASLLVALPFAGAKAHGDAPAPSLGGNLEQVCKTQPMQAIASAVVTTRVTVGEVTLNPKFPGGTRYVPANGLVPAFCQVTGHFVTNPATGKTASFLATFPSNWNGKYLQIGCSGHCGNFLVSDPAQRTITVSEQGYPNQIIIKGYAAFATDQGHDNMTAGAWAIKGPGKVDQDAVTDYLYRADKVLAKMGKAFTRTLYTQLKGVHETITRAYFSGCSGGGRDALVAASYFPEEFDGIVAGSPYNLGTRGFHAAATALATLRAPDARLSQAQLDLFDKAVKANCDATDGVADGLIQNPMACNFRPRRDLPRCMEGESTSQCFTKSQIETLEIALNATTDEMGHVVQPGYSVSELQNEFAPRGAPKDPANPDLWGDDGSTISMWPLANAVVKTFTYGNDPAFHLSQIVSFREGGPGQVRDMHSVVPAAVVAKVIATNRLGVGHLPENAARLIQMNHKLLIWHNFSDEKLTPYNSVNYYKELARKHGGYAKLQKNVRLFALPGTAHCGAGGVAPNNFDAVGAIENWVEKGQAPDELPAALYDAKSMFVDPKKTPIRTMPLCKFPEMARYDGTGDKLSAASWHCPADDSSMLKMGEAGQQAGVL